MSNVPVIITINLPPSLKTLKQNKSLVYNSTRIIKILNNIIDDSVEVYYNTFNEDEIEILLNLMDNDRRVFIFYKQQFERSYIYLGEMSQIVELENLRNGDVRYFNFYLDEKYYFKIPQKTDCCKKDILKHLGYSQNNINLKNNIIDLKD